MLYSYPPSFLPYLLFHIMACPVPTAISNGYYVGAKVSYAAGDVIQYVCNTNYVMSGSPVTVCDVSGMWVPASGSLPECNNSYLSNSKSMPRVMQFVCNALYLHSSMNHKIQWILQFRLGVYMHVFITQKFVSTWVHLTLLVFFLYLLVWFLLVISLMGFVALVVVLILTVICCKVCW